MRFAVTAAAAMACAAMLASAAQAQSVSSVDRKGIKRIIVYGTEACPPSPPGEIVICARRPDNDRYRIPERFRQPDELTGENEAWAYQAERLEMHGAGGIQSCSPVGPGGASGCMQQLINSARRERQSNESRESNIP
jgi:hypothetical protein